MRLQVMTVVLPVSSSWAQLPRSILMILGVFLNQLAATPMTAMRGTGMRIGAPAIFRIHMRGTGMRIGVPAIFRIHMRGTGMRIGVHAIFILAIPCIMNQRNSCNPDWSSLQS